MMTVEVLVRDLNAARRHQLGERMLAALTAEEGAPESVMDGVRELTHVLVQQPES